MTAASSLRIRLSDPRRASELRAYFRRHDALAIDNDDGTLDVHLLRPFSSWDDERGLVRSYLLVWNRRAASRSSFSTSSCSRTLSVSQVTSMRLSARQTILNANAWNR